MNGMLERLYRSKAAESAPTRRSRATRTWTAGSRAVGRAAFVSQRDRARASAAIVAEVKHASPSAGVIVRDFDAVRIAQFYEEARPTPSAS